VVDETVHIKARITGVAARCEITKEYFIRGAVAIFAGTSTGLLTKNPLLGIVLALL
jgi:hypothetical protein